MTRLMTIAGLALAGSMMVGLAAANAEMVKYKAELSPAMEVPPVKSEGKGAAEVTYDTASKKLTWEVTYSGLTGPATAAHFHGPAAVGANAPPTVPIQGSLASPIKGEATLTDVQATALTGGQLYFNIHTAANGGGEIRGQVVK